MNGIQPPELSSYSLNKSASYNLHQSHLSAGKTHNSDALRIIEAFGGIDEVLSKYLSDDNKICISDHQLQQLYEILNGESNESTTQQHSDLKYVQIMSNHHYFYSFDTEDTFAVSLCGAKWAEWINFFLHHKFTRLYTVIAYCIWIALYIICVSREGSNEKWKNELYEMLSIYTIALSICCAIPGEILVILSANREATSFIVHSFEFWLKVSYSALLTILVAIYWFQRNATTTNEFRIAHLIGHILFGISTTGLVVCVGLFFGVSLSYR